MEPQTLYQKWKALGSDLLQMQQATPVFEYEHHDEQQRLAFHYLCEECAQKKLAEWLQCAQSPDYAHLGYQTDFDIATVFYEQKNDEETLLLTRWSQNKRDAGYKSTRSKRQIAMVSLANTGHLYAKPKAGLRWYTYQMP